jgi:hypothetical protein
MSCKLFRKIFFEIFFLSSIIPRLSKNYAFFKAGCKYRTGLPLHPNKSGPSLPIPPETSHSKAFQIENILPQNAFRIPDPLQIEPHRRRGKIRLRAIPSLQHLTEAIQPHLSPARLHHRTHQSADHPAQETVRLHPVFPTEITLHPLTPQHRTILCPYLRVALGERTEVMRAHHHRRSRPHHPGVQRIR